MWTVIEEMFISDIRIYIWITFRYSFRHNGLFTTFALRFLTVRGTESQQKHSWDKSWTISFTSPLAVLGETIGTNVLSFETRRIE